MNTEEIKMSTEKVNRYAQSVLSPDRYEHSRRVAILAQELCALFSVDPDAGYLAGIAHDMCKAGKENWLLSMVIRDRLPVSAIEQKKPSLLHGRAAAVLMAAEFGVTDPSILEAVKNHTFGAPALDALGKIIFVADKIEPGRTGMDPDFRAEIDRARDRGDLDGMVIMVLEDNMRYLTAKGKEVSASTLSMLEDLKGRDAGK